MEWPMSCRLDTGTQSMRVRVRAVSRVARVRYYRSLRAPPRVLYGVVSCGEVCAAVSFRCVLRAVPRAGLLVEFFRVVEICVVSRIN